MSTVDYPPPPSKNEDSDSKGKSNAPTAPTNSSLRTMKIIPSTKKKLKSILKKPSGDYQPVPVRKINRPEYRSVIGKKEVMVNESSIEGDLIKPLAIESIKMEDKDNLSKSMQHLNSSKPSTGVSKEGKRSGKLITNKFYYILLII